MNLILRWLFNSLGLLLVAEFVPGIMIDGLYSALMAALVLGFLNTLVRPILLLLTLPITILTLGLFAFIVNALLFWFVASFLEGFTVGSFFAALIGSLVMSLISAIGNRWLKPRKRAPARVEYRELRD